MILDHAYPELERDEQNDLYDLKRLESKTKVEFLGFIKDKNYQDPNPVNHQNWRNEDEMKEAGYDDELKILESFKDTRNEWFVKEEKKKSRKSTPKVQADEGSSSQPKKRRKKAVETLLVDEPDEEEPEAKAEAEDEIEAETEVNVGIDGKDDDAYIPSPEYVSESQTPPAGGRKKSSTRKSVVSLRAARKNLIVRLLKRTPKAKSSQPPPPPPEPSPPQSPFHLSPLHQSPPHISPPHQTPIQEQPVLTSQQIFQTPPSTQPPIQTTPGSCGYKTFPNVPTEGITLDEIGDFGFANDEHVKKLEKKVEEVVVEIRG
ncbi:hypothetical protein Hanom_Chr05g00411361 [Helianthus anomalus]